MAQPVARGKFAYPPADTSNLPHYAPQHLHHVQHLEPKRGYSLDDSSSSSGSSHTEPRPLLDLDHDISMRGSMQHYRKDSFANSTGVLSPVDPNAWDSNPQYHAGLPVDQQSQAAGFVAQYHDDASNGFARHHSISHTPAYPPHALPQHGSWAPMPHGSGHATPASGFEPAHSQAAEGAPFMQRNGSAHGSYHHAQAQAPNGFAAQSQADSNFIAARPQADVSFIPAQSQADVNFIPAQPQADVSFIAARPQGDASFIATPQVHTPMSPHSHQDWMAIAAQEMECRPMLKRVRPNSPPRTMVDFQRRDGIRKKNGRIDIPQERNIHTIDDLIEKTTDDNMLKELKQQKRLLRNREAALASRQRKKKHTEELEGREKGYSSQLQTLEQSCADLTLERDQLAHSHQILIHRTQEADRIIEALQMEKRDMMMKHNEETSTLRKRVLLLTEQLDAGPAPGMSANPSSTGFGNFNAEMEALSMGSHEWDFGFGNELHIEQHGSDFGFESQPQQHTTVEKKASSSTIVRKPAEEQGQQQPLASGLLFMLLLCGAFVASRPATSSSNATDLPITAEIRAAAPTVLNNLLAGAGALQTHQDGNGHEPQPSHIPQSQRPHTSSNRLDTLHQRLLAPTKQQDYDAAFSLTSAQYAALAGEDVEYDEPLPPKRTLAQAFSAEGEGSTAEVYTRSLLFEQIPASVVARFREMVAERGVWKEEN